MEEVLDSSLRTLIFGEFQSFFNKIVNNSHNGLAVNCAAQREDSVKITRQS